SSALPIFARSTTDADPGAGRGRSRAVSIARDPRISRRDPPAAAAVAERAGGSRPRAGLGADRRLRLASADRAASAQFPRARTQARRADAPDVDPPLDRRGTGGARDPSASRPAHRP